MIKIIEGSFLEKIKEIEDNSIDFVLTDPPYQITQCSWDKLIPFNSFVVIDDKLMEKEDYLLYAYRKGVNYKDALKYFNENKENGMWQELERVTKKDSIVALFCAEPFASKLIQSNVKNFKYCWYWKKNKSTNFLNAKKQPLRNIEYIAVFYKGDYFPQKTTGHKPVNSFTKHTSDGETMGKTKKGFSGGGSTERYPTQTLEFKVVNNDNSGEDKFHPTQKPIEILKYLLQTYTKKGETILDFTAGSFSTGVACRELDRKFIGIELDHKYIKIGKDRLNM
jgi:DNA modification methylase